MSSEHSLILTYLNESTKFESAVIYHNRIIVGFNNVNKNRNLADNRFWHSCEDAFLKCNTSIFSVFSLLESACETFNSSIFLSISKKNYFLLLKKFIPKTQYVHFIYLFIFLSFFRIGWWNSEIINMFSSNRTQKKHFSSCYHNIS